MRGARLQSRVTWSRAESDTHERVGRGQGGGDFVRTSLMQRRGKLADCVGNGTTGGNDGADRSQFVMRQLADISGFVSVVGLSDNRSGGRTKG